MSETQKEPVLLASDETPADRRSDRIPGFPHAIVRPRSCRLFIIIGMLMGLSAWTHAQNPPGNGSAPAARLQETITRHLAAGEVAAAIEAAHRALEAHPRDAAVRRHFVDLHLSLARRWLAEESFDKAEQSLLAVLKVDESNEAAGQFIRRIADARLRVDARVKEAHQWIDLEWYEPAFVAFRQACALSPARRGHWIKAYRHAAIGAGDDHYITKNFHEAFYYYDAALVLGDETGASPSMSLLDRWVQCLAHALSRDVDRAAYPPAFWQLALRRAAGMEERRHRSQDILYMLRGLAYENLGDSTRATGEYAKYLKERPSAAWNTRQLRDRAIVSLRKRYDVNLCGRRTGVWRDSVPGAWQALDVPRFRIHHRNARVAQRVADAAAFHFDRISKAFAIDPAGVPWKTVCEIHIHADLAAFQRATRADRDARAVSIIESRGSLLQKHEIHLYQSDPMLLAGSLSHELAHLIAGAITRYRPMPGALSEGLALSMEPQCRHRQFARLFRDLERPRPLRALLNIPQVHPTDASFYSESHRLVAVLRAQGGLGPILDLSGKNIDAARLATAFGFENVESLQNAYLAAQSTVRTP